MAVTRRLGYADTIEYYARDPEMRAMRGMKPGAIMTNPTVKVIATIFGWDPIDVANSFVRRWAAETPADLLKVSK